MVARMSLAVVLPTLVKKKTFFLKLALGRLIVFLHSLYGIENS